MKTRRIIISIVSLIVVISAFVAWRITVMSSNHIADNNGADTALEVVNIKNYFENNEGYNAFSSTLKKRGSRSRKTKSIAEYADFDVVQYSFGKFSGMKLIQESEVSFSVVFYIESSISEGNFEIAFYKDNKFIELVEINQSMEITYNDGGVYSIVIGGESAKGEIKVVRTIKNN